MALEQLIAKGDKELKEKDYLSAIATYSAALKEHLKSFQAFIKRSTAYQKLNNYESAKKDISDAFAVAEGKGKRAELGICYFRLGLIYYAEKNYKLALKNFENAVEFDCPETTVETWRSKCEYDLKKNPPVEQSDDEDHTELLNAVSISEDKSEQSQSKASTNIDVINNQAPLKVKIRDDWYQTNDSVIITIYAKNIKEQDLQIQFKPTLVSVSFPSSATSEYNYNLDPLFAEIDPENSSSRIYGTKLEITIKKKVPHKWTTLEASGEISSNSNKTDDLNSTENKQLGLVYPSSSKKSINWSAFKVNDDDEKEKSENDFFAQLYKDTDDDTRRAMMKSYVESNGTVLTTNWDEAKGKKFETSPPEGMVAKKWDEKP